MAQARKETTAKAPPGPPDAITLSDIVLYRSWIEGIELRWIIDQQWRHLGLDGTPRDVKKIESRVRLIKETLRRTALRHGLIRDAMVLRGSGLGRRRRRPEHGATPPRGIDAFREAMDPHDFLPHDELEKAWRASAGNDEARDPGSDDGKTIGLSVIRQIQAVNRVGELVRKAPRDSDSVLVWLEDPTASRVLAAGIARIGQLREVVSRFPKDWFAPVHGLGRSRARRIERWLSMYPGEGAGNYNSAYRQQA